MSKWNWIYMVSLALSFGTFMLGCSPSLKVEAELQKSLHTNEQAPSYQDWIASDHTPEATFDRFQQQVESGQLQISVLCEPLSRLPDQDLSLFSIQIQDPEHAELMKDCLPELNRRLANIEAETLQEFEKKVQQEGWNSPIVAGTSDANQPADPTTPGDSSPAKANQNQLKVKPILIDSSQGMTLDGRSLPEKHVVLTFDDGPNPTYTTLIQRTLERYQTRAHFFVVGNSLGNFGSIVKGLAQKGHSISNHTVRHPCLGSVKACGQQKSVGGLAAKKDIQQAHQMIFNLLGFVDPFFRFPYGASTPEMRAFVKKSELVNFSWNIDSADWRQNQTWQNVQINTIRGIEAQKRGIILFHDINPRTPLALPGILDHLVKNGYQLSLYVPVDRSTRSRHPLLGPLLP